MDFLTDETQRFANLPPQLVEAEALYRKLMDGLVIGQGFVRSEKLREHHDHSIKSSLEIATNSTTLTEESKKSIKIILDNLFTHYESLNLEEQPKEKEAGGLLRHNPAIGIDLGTTNCSVAVYENGKIRLIKNDIGPSKTPSFVAFHNNDNNDTDTDDDPVAGDVAKKLAHAYPQTTIFDIKLMIGRQFTDPQIQKNINLQRWPFELKQCSTTGEILIKTGKHNKWTTPQVILSYLIKYLKKTAEEALDSVVHDAVVATPAYFNDRQRELTKKACEEAGLNVIQLVNELTASAIGYNEHKIPTNTNKTKDKDTQNNPESEEGPRNVLIFDLGGGTFDVAIVTINGKEINIEAVGGDSCIGGQIFDNNMVDYCVQEFKRKHDIDLKRGLTTDPEESSLYKIEDTMPVSSLFRRLQMECEEQKRFFTHINKVWIKLEDIHNGQGLNVPISREAFDSVNLLLFQKCMDIVEKVIEDARLHKTDIHDIVLVGGSSKILRVQQMLTELFDGKELWLADEAVAVGAAMLAYYAQTENPNAPNIISIQEPTHFVPVAPVLELVNTPVKVIAVFPKEKSQSKESSLLTTNSYRKISSEAPASPVPAPATITNANLVEEMQPVYLDADPPSIEIQQDSDKSINITKVTNTSDSDAVLSPVKPTITKRKLMPVSFAEKPIVNGHVESAPVPVSVSSGTKNMKILPSNPNNVVVDSDSIIPAEGQKKLTAVDNFAVSPPVVNKAVSSQDVGQINTTQDFSRIIKKNLPFIEFKGYLKRKILQVKSKPVTGKKSDWENVFVALRGGYLQICKDEASCQDNEDLSNLIDIDNSICDSKDYLGEQRSFILKLSSSQYQFLAEEAAVIKQWVDKIRQNSNLPPIIQRAHPLKYSFKSKTLLKDLQNCTLTNKPQFSENILRGLSLSGTNYEKEEAAINTPHLLRSETTKKHVICCNYGTRVTVTSTGHLPKMKAFLNKEINPPPLTHHKKSSFQLPVNDEIIQRYKTDMPGGPGSTLIISNTFDQPDNGELQSYEIIGVEKDHELMKELFQDVLKNDVMSCRNVPSTALDGILKEFKRSCINKNSDYCIVIIMSRGCIDANSVLMSDIKTVDFYQHIFNKFNHDNFPHFVSKPKLFFLESCDGSLDFIDYKNGYESGRSQADMPSELECERVGHGMILDYFISRASFPRSRTYREVGCSSYYFQAIYEVFKEFWKTTDLEVMHKLASGGVAEMWSFLSNHEQWPSEWGVQQPLQINELRCPFFFLQREKS